MADLKKKGDLAELKVAADLMGRGYGIAVPWGEDCDFDLIAYRDDELHRVQVKHVTSDGRVVALKCTSHSLTNGRVRHTKRYTARTIDWIAAWDATSDRCFYVPAAELGDGRSCVHLRLTPSLNNQRRRVNLAEDYERFGPELSTSSAQLEMMEPVGFEPTTSRMQTGRSTN
jgi:hypothetical protein